MLALVCCLSCHVSPLVLNLKRVEAVLLTEQRPRRPRPLVCSLQSSQPLAHWQRGGFRRVTWQRKESPARTPPFPERLCFFGTTHFVVCVPLPLHENSYIRCLVPCCVCVGPLILKTMTLGSLGDRASELIDDLVPKRVKLGLNPGCTLKFLACSIRGQDRLSFLGPEGQTLPPFLTLPLRS